MKVLHQQLNKKFVWTVKKFSRAPGAAEEKQHRLEGPAGGVYPTQTGMQDSECAEKTA